MDCFHLPAADGRRDSYALPEYVGDLSPSGSMPTTVFPSQLRTYACPGPFEMPILVIDAVALPQN